MATERMVNIRGLREVTETLRGLPKKIRGKALLSSLRAAARPVRDEARRRAPVLKISTLSGAAALRSGRRAIGTLRNAITVRTSKAARRSGDVGVFVNVRPLKEGRSAKNPKDPYYWRWQNWGWNPSSAALGGSGRRGKAIRRTIARNGSGKFKQGARFLEAGASRLPDALAIFEKTLGPQIQRFQTKGTKA